MTASVTMLPIPVAAARDLAVAHGYDQMVIIARRIGAAPYAGEEQCVTWGTVGANANAAAQIGALITRRVMGWKLEKVVTREDDTDAVNRSLISAVAAIDAALPLLAATLHSLVIEDSYLEAGGEAPRPGTLGDESRVSADLLLQAIRAAEGSAGRDWRGAGGADDWLLELIDGRRPL